MRGTVPTINCDGEDGYCGAWDIDNYEASVTAVSDHRITYYERAPGWFSNHVYDYCPTHRPEESPDE